MCPFSKSSAARTSTTTMSCFSLMARFNSNGPVVKVILSSKYCSAFAGLFFVNVCVIQQQRRITNRTCDRRRCSRLNPADAEPLHHSRQRRALQTEAGRRTLRAADDPVGFSQRLDDMF